MTTTQTRTLASPSARCAHLEIYVIYDCPAPIRLTSSAYAGCVAYTGTVTGPGGPEGHPPLRRLHCTAGRGTSACRSGSRPLLRFARAHRLGSHLHSPLKARPHGTCAPHTQYSPSTQDLSGRPHLTFDCDIPTERIGTYDTQLVRHRRTSCFTACRRANICKHLIIGHAVSGLTSHDVVLGCKPVPF